MPVAAIARVASSAAGVGFAFAAPTGIALLATQATEYIGNPFLPIKLLSIAVALVNVVASHRSAAWRALTTRELTVQERRRLAVCRRDLAGVLDHGDFRRSTDCLPVSVGRNLVQRDAVARRSVWLKSSPA